MEDEIEMKRFTEVRSSAFEGARAELSRWLGACQARSQQSRRVSTSIDHRIVITTVSTRIPISARSPAPRAFPLLGRPRAIVRSAISKARSCAERGRGLVDLLELRHTGAEAASKFGAVPASCAVCTHPRMCHSSHVRSNIETRKRIAQCVAACL
jgi:hypothetical protein